MKAGQIFSRVSKVLCVSYLSHYSQIVYDEIQRYNNQTTRIIEEDHIEELLNRLRRIDGITVDESRFYQVIANAGGNLNEITDTIKNQLKPDVPHHERVIFVH